MPNIPVFLINGFLDSGKTTFIKKTFARDGFSKRGKTLYIRCEEGEEDFTEEELKLYNVEMVTLENEDDNQEKIEIKDEDFGIFYIDTFDNRPAYEDKIITLIDGLTFPIYFKNMRQQFVDVIKASDVVAFTKLHDDRSSLAQYKTTLRVINSQCLYCLINEDCLSTMEAFEKELPYDLTIKKKLKSKMKTLEYSILIPLITVQLMKIKLLPLMPGLSEAINLKKMNSSLAEKFSPAARMISSSMAI